MSSIGSEVALAPDDADRLLDDRGALERSNQPESLRGMPGLDLFTYPIDHTGDFTG